MRALVVVAAAAGLMGCGRLPAATPPPIGGRDGGRSLPDGGTVAPTEAGSEASRDVGTEAGICGVHGPFGPQLYANAPPSAYEGPVLVERSTAKDIVFLFEPSGSGADDGGVTGAADASATTGGLPVHVTLAGHDPMPELPLGARVWLSVPAANPMIFGPRQPWSVSVRDRQGGRLLLGAALNPSDTVPSPVPLGAIRPFCTAPNPDTCLPGTSVTYDLVDIAGDRTVTIADSATATVPIGGIDYAVRVTAQELASSANSNICLDYSPISGVAVDAQAQDLPSLASTLDIGPLPACVEGNALFEGASFAITGVNVRNGYDGPAVYSHTADGYLYFSVPGLGGFENDLPLLQIYAPGLIQQPNVGDQFWASLTSSGVIPFVAALSSAQGGPLLLASVSGPAPFDPAFAAAIEARLGVRVDAAENCAYAPDGAGGVVSLWDTVFETAPPVHVGSESTGIVSIAGRDYNVWAMGERSFVSFTLQAR